MSEEVSPGQVWELRLPDHRPLRLTVEHVYLRRSGRRVHFIGDTLDTTPEHLLSSPDWHLVVDEAPDA